MKVRTLPGSGWEQGRRTQDMSARPRPLLSQSGVTALVRSYQPSFVSLKRMCRECLFHKDTSRLVKVLFGGRASHSGPTRFPERELFRLKDCQIQALT